MPPKTFRRLGLPIRLLGLIVWTALVLSGCARVDLLNALIPVGSITVAGDIPYAAGNRHKLDIYLPKSLTPGVPVIVFFYGGAWQTGDKGDYLFAAQALATTGAIVVVPDY